MTMIADLKTYLEITDNSFDSLLTMFLDAQKNKADSYLGLAYFGTVTGATDKFDTGSIFRLAYANLSSVVVQIVAGTDYVTVDPTTYDVDAARGIVRIKSGVLYGPKRGIEITYNGGYGEDAVPTEMKFAIIKQASYEFRRRKDPGLMSVSFPDGSVSKFETGEWLPDVEQTLNKYRRIWI